MKVWLVTIYEPLPFGAGTTRPQRCGMLARALLDAGHDVELWTSTFEHVKHSHLYTSSTHVQLSDRMSLQYMHGCGYSSDYSPKRWLHNRQTAAAFSEIARGRQASPDLIFAPVPSLELAEAAVVFGRRSSIPVVVDIRDLWPDVYYTMFPDPIRPFVRPLFYAEALRIRRICQGATGLTGVSQSYLSWALKHAGRDGTALDRFFPLGFAAQTSKALNPITRSGEVRRRYGIPVDATLAIYVGSFSDFYDIDCVLQSAKLLQGRNDLHIAIVGDGEGRERLFSMGRSLHNVTMTGWLDHSDVRELLHASDIGLVAYSKTATMSLPNKPFEYLSAGLPLVSSLRGELEEILSTNKVGIQYEAGDATSLSERLEWCIGNPNAVASMKHRALQLFEERYTSKAIYTDMAAHMEMISSARSVRGAGPSLGPALLGRSR